MLILELTGCLLEIKYCSAHYDAHYTDRCLLYRILNSSMTVMCQQLHDFKQHCAAKNDQADKNDMSGISQAKQQPESSKRGEMFKTGWRGQSRPCVDRRNRCVSDEDEQRQAATAISL